MLVNSIPVDVVGGAYEIAANYLKKTDRMPHELDIYQPLFDSIIGDFKSGTRSKLKLANRAIARIERASQDRSLENPQIEWPDR